jgi:hypothetical protein
MPNGVGKARLSPLMGPIPTRTVVSSQAPPEFTPGRYMTDGRRLFRVVSPFEGMELRSAELEDCLTLQVGRYSADELFGMGLKPVCGA